MRFKKSKDMHIIYNLDEYEMQYIHDKYTRGYYELFC